MRNWAKAMKANTAVVAVFLILMPLSFAGRHQHHGVASGTHCQTCLSMVLAVSVIPTTPRLMAPIQSPFRLLPIPLTVENSTGATARNRAPPESVV